VFQFRSTIKKEENFMMKSLLIGLAALLVLATGATAAESKQSKNPLRPGNVNRLCVWVEQGGTPDTSWDLKAVKAYTATHKVCIVGKAGKNGKNGKNGKAGAKGAQGAQGAAGAQGAKGDAGAQGAKGDAGAKGADGAPGPQGPPGPKGDAGFSGLVTVAGGSSTGEKQFTVSCPLNLTTPAPNDRYEAVSGGFNIQGSVTADYRSDALGVDTGKDSWTIIQSSNALGSGKVYVYCLAPAA